jgi:hypothetical protein
MDKYTTEYVKAILESLALKRATATQRGDLEVVIDRIYNDGFTDGATEGRKEATPTGRRK